VTTRMPLLTHSEIGRFETTRLDRTGWEYHEGLGIVVAYSNAFGGFTISHASHKV
jgi:hypothetical protein